jgi:ribosomal protein S18 acetylase RimI-like enzyme
MIEMGTPGAGGVGVTPLPARPRAIRSATIIRPFAEGDATDVATLWRESATEWPGGGPFGGRHATAKSVRHEQRARHPLETFIAWRDDPTTGWPVAVGYCSLLTQPDDATATYVGLLTAHPAWQGQGVGRDLLMAAISRTFEIGRDRIDLHTWSGNLKAVPLYKKVGFFWVPDTSVRMANFLPMLIRIAVVRAFFEETGADWYADSVRTLDLKPDRDSRRGAEVYRYRWERDGARLEAIIDRHSNALVALATPNFEVGVALDDPRIPTGTKRTSTFHLTVPHDRFAVTAAFVANGTGAVRSSRQAHRTVAPGTTAMIDWAVEGALSVPPSNPRPGTASLDSVAVLAVIDDEPVSFACAARVVAPVAILIDDLPPLRPGYSRTTWVTLENETDQQQMVDFSAVAIGSFTVTDGSKVTQVIAPRSRASFPCTVRASGEGSGTLHLTARQGSTPPTLVSVPLHAGDPGALFVEQTGAHVRVITDELVVTAPLTNSGWQPTFTIADRHTGHALLRHACGLGPPFSPSSISASTWTPTVTHRSGAVAIVLQARPADLPGVTFERHIRVAGSGIIDVAYVLVNGSPSSLAFDVGTGTSAELDGVRRTRIACMIDGTVVDDESDAFPDWEEPNGGASRLTEGWIAEYGDGMVVGAMWTEAEDVHGDGRLAELVLPLGEVEAGSTSSTSILRLYAGPGDWRAVRARWQTLAGVAITAGVDEPRHRVDTATLACPVSVNDVHETDLILTRANDTPHEGSVCVIADGASTPEFLVSSLRALTPTTERISIQMPKHLGAVNAVARLTTGDTTTHVALPLVRVGRPENLVTTIVNSLGSRDAVTLDTGPMRVRLLPTQRARIVAIETPSVNGTWVDNLLSSAPEPRPWVWFNPWFGGISAHLRETGWHTGQTPLDHASWTWHPTKVHRAGVEWHGVTTVATIDAPTGPISTPESVESARLAGTSVEVAYLVAGGGTTIVVEATVRNEAASRLRGTLSIPTYWKPGGAIDGVTVHYDRCGPRSRRRAHGAHWSTVDGWVAIVDRSGTQIPVIVATDTATTLMTGDMGLHGVHPFASTALDLKPGQSHSLRLWVAIAGDLDQARAWRNVVGTPLPPQSDYL